MDSSDRRDLPEPVAWPLDPYRVETPERIDLAYDVAGLGSRFLAALVDTILVMITALLVLWLGTVGLQSALQAGLAVIGPASEQSGFSLISLALAISVLLAFAVIWGYFVFFEVIWHGQTPGKRWVGLRVIKEGGYPLGFVDSVIRNVVRLADFLPAYYMLGAIVMFVDPRSRRLGDLAAGTLVVRERREFTPASLVAESPAGQRPGRIGLSGAVGTSLSSSRLGSGGPGLGPVDAPSSAVTIGGADLDASAGTLGADEPPIPNRTRLTPADQSLLREYLLRRPSLSAPAANALAVRLATAFARKLDYDLGDEPPEIFLARLARHIGRR